MARVARLAAVCSVIAASLTGAALGTSTPSGATSPVVATGGDGTATIEADAGTVVELRPIDGTPTTHPGGTVDGGGVLVLSPSEVGLYEVWAHVGSADPAYEGAVVVRSSIGEQDLLAQSEMVGADPLHRFGYLEVDAEDDRALLSFDLRLPLELAEPIGTCDSEDPPTRGEGDDAEDVTCSAQVPTLLEYSVYDASNPGPVNLENDLDSTPEVDRGYAALAVNVRGTGCSSGVLGTLPVDAQQGTDGAEAVEVLAGQSWSTHRVGMVGTSVPGIEQLNVAAHNPPHLVAITPAAAAARPYDAAYPGGIPSRNFDWWSTVVRLLNAPSTVTSTQRKAEIDAAFGYQWELLAGEGEDEPTHGRDEIENSWIYQRSSTGDEVCRVNADEHAANILTRTTVDANTTFTGPWPSLDFRDLLADTTVPTLLINGLNDELGPRGFDRLFDVGDDPQPGVPATVGTATPTTPLDGSGDPNSLIRVVTGSGGHNLSESPEAMTERDAFLDLLVAERAVPAAAGAVPRTRPSSGSTTCLPRYLQGVTGTRSAQLDALYAAAPVILYWEQTEPQPGGYPLPLPGTTPVGIDGEPCSGARFVSSASTWPLVASTQVLELGADGSLDASSPASGTVGFDATARNKSWLSLGRPHVSRPPSGEAAVFTSAPLTTTTAYAGPASVDLSVVSDEPVVDLEVTITEVAADSSETIVRSGWRRTSVPEDATNSTSLQPRLNDATVSCTSTVTTWCLDPSTPKAIRVPISSFNHVFRAGSRIRVTVAGPGYSELAMPFLTQPVDGPAALSGADVGIVVGGANDTRLVLSPAATPTVVGDDPGVNTPPTCGTVVNQACFQRGVTVTAQHPYDGSDHTVLHVDWDTDNLGPRVDGYHVYLDDEAVPAATVDRPLYPGALGVPALFGSADVTITDGDEPTSVRVVPFVHEAGPPATDLDLAEIGSAEVSVPSTDGSPGVQLLNEDSSTSEALELTDPPRWTRLDEKATLALVSPGHDSSDKAVELTMAPDAHLPLATLGITEDDIFPVTAGHPYHVEGWFKGGPDATRAGLAIVWWDHEGVVHLSVEPIDLAADQDWTLHELNANPPPGAQAVTAAVVMLDPAIDEEDESRSVIIDDVALCEGRLSCVPPS